MAFPVTQIWNVQSGGNDATNGNGGGFDPANANFVADGSATAANTAAPIFSSASYTFLARDVNAWLFLPTGAFAGWYNITAVAGGKATLNATAGAAVSYGLAAGVNLNSPTTQTGISASASPSSLKWGIDYSQTTSPAITYSDA